MNTKFWLTSRTKIIEYYIILEEHLNDTSEIGDTFDSNARVKVE